MFNLCQQTSGKKLLYYQGLQGWNAAYPFTQQPPAHWLPEPHLKPGISKQAPGLRQCPHSCHCDNVPLQESLTWGGYILVTNYRWNDTFRTLGLPRALVSHLHCARSFLLGLWGRVVVACGLLLSPNIRRGHYTHVPSSEKFINF